MALQPASSALSRTRRPEGMSLEAWQTALRRDFGRAQRFRLENLGREPIFSEFTVTNPTTQGSYRVAIRGRNPGDNYCSCPDFAVNALGTCKHIMHALEKVKRRFPAPVRRRPYQSEQMLLHMHYT